MALIKYDVNHPHGINGNRVNCFYDDKKGNILVSGGAINLFNKKSKKLSPFAHENNKKTASTIMSITFVRAANHHKNFYQVNQGKIILPRHK